jgi:homocysteine S-methyltransferase
MLGFNCSLGPKQMLEYVAPFIPLSPIPVLIMPNAGAPQRVSDRTLYLTSPEYFASYARRFVETGACAVGGCCGTGPEHIAEAARLLKAGERRSLVVESLQAGQDTGSAGTIRADSGRDTAEGPRPGPVQALSGRSALGRKLAEGQFVTSVELVPPMGYDLSRTVERARRCAEAGVDAINIPDGPRASSRVSPMVTAMRIQSDAGIEAVLHVTCRDRNIIGVQSDLLGCAAAGIRNLLIVTGDPPKLGDYPFATAVFDLDSIGLTRAAARLNGGLDIAGKPVEPATGFVLGVGADPTNLDMEREIGRFFQKAAAGADFAITQPVYDAEALLSYIGRVKETGVRIIAGIWPLASYNNALFMNNEVPGVTIPEPVMEIMRKASGKEEARRAGIETARELLRAVRPYIAGVQVSAPFGNVETALEVLKGYS